MSDDDNKILRPDFQATADTSSSTLTFKRKQTYCRHRNVEVGEYQRTVSCAHCNANLDPFTIILEYARDDRSALWTEKEVKKLEQSIAQLKKEERRIKARIRNAKNTASKQGVLF